MLEVASTGKLARVSELVGLAERLRNIGQDLRTRQEALVVEGRFGAVRGEARRACRRYPRRAPLAQATWHGQAAGGPKGMKTTLARAHAVQNVRRNAGQSSPDRRLTAKRGQVEAGRENKMRYSANKMSIRNH